MNKALHVFVYLYLVLVGAGLWFEVQLNNKRDQLIDRNRMQEDYFVRLARTIEKDDAPKAEALELLKDTSTVDAKLVANPEEENLLEEYNNHYEQPNLETYSWENMTDRGKLRQVYVTRINEKGDEEVVMDGNEPLKRGSPEDKMLDMLLESAKKQQTRLNNTRAELVSLRGKLEEITAELNALKPIARQDKVTIVEKTAKIAKLEEIKADLEDQIVKLKAQIEELYAEITSLKDNIANLQNEIEEKNDIIAKNEKLIEQLKKLLREALASRSQSSAARGTAVKSLPAGDKAKIVEADNENMFAIIEFSDDAIMKELKGENLDHPLPALELGVKRPGFNGPAGEFVGRLRLRQEVAGKRLAICDILGNWEQAKLQPGDIIYAD